MIFDALYESARRGELILVNGGFYHWHLRRDGQLTIREIISTQHGAGSRMLDTLKVTPGVTCIFAKCPVDLPANEWYAKRGFVLEGNERTRSGRILNLWRLSIAPTVTGDLPK